MIRTFVATLLAGIFAFVLPISAQIAPAAGVTSFPATFAGALYLGSGTSTNSVNPMVTINRAIAASGANYHGFSDSSSINLSGGADAYAAFDARYTVTGTANYDHFAHYQSSPTIGTSGTTGASYGLYSTAIVNTGTVSSLYGLYVADATGTGTVTNQYGIKVVQLAKGANNYGIYIENNNSYFNGQIQIGVNTPAYLSAPSDGALSITAAGSNKSITLTPSGTGSVNTSGNLLVSGGYLYSDRTTTPAVVLNTSGSNYGQIFMASSSSHALGYNTTAGTSGTKAVEWFSNNSVAVGKPSLATNATDGFLYVPTCAGTPTGTPTTVTGFVPIVVDTTNSRWYFYSGGAWRNAGP